MDEFLSGLANYTEKENPYHSIDACPGTDFYNTEKILKLFYPLIVFHLDGEFRILCNQKVIGFNQLRYYLNFVILPRVTQYWEQTPTRSDIFQDYNEIRGLTFNYQEDIQQMNEFIAKYYPGTVSEKEYQELYETEEFDRGLVSEYIRVKTNDYKRDIKIKEALDTLKQLDFGLGDVVERIKTYLQTIRYAG